MKSKKFHFVLAASRTSDVSTSNFLNINANSLTNAILISLCVFSITFAASAVLIDAALKTPAFIILLYTFAIISRESLSHPETTLTIFSIVCTLSPGFILSGLYPTLKSSLNFNDDISSYSGTHISSVAPG